MFPERITVFLFLGLSFAQDAMGQNSTTTVMPTQSVNVTTRTEATTERGETTPTTVKPTCAKIKFVAEQMWNASLGKSESEEFKKWKNMTFMEMKYLYNDHQKYYDVNVSGVAFSNKEGKVGVEAKLCLVVKVKGSGFIETVFTSKVKNGQLHKLKVVSGSAEFTPEGVQFKDWKAKDGECDKCSGAGGEITIKGRCVPEQYSCNGLKEEKMAKDCVEHCHGGTVSITVSFLVLAFGMLLSFSSQ